MPVLLWLRNDLRINDHEALHEAAQGDAQVIPVYCVDPRHYRTTRWGVPKTGGFRARFLIESLEDLRLSYQDLGADLVIRHGPPEDVLPELVRTYEARAVYAHQEVTSEEVEVEEAVAAALRGTDASLRLFWGHTLYHPDDIPFGVSDVPNVFTPFRKRVEKKASVRKTFSAPQALPALPEGLDPGALPTGTDLGVPLAETDERGVLPFKGGENAGLDRLDAYIWHGDHLKVYKETRNGLLGADYSSKFSAWLANGSLSPRLIYEDVKQYEAERTKNSSTYWMVFELIWRDFFRFVARKFGTRLFYQSGPMDRTIEWEQDDEAFERWAAGTTGIPFIDANMRELNATGFMSNRGRQNVASFLAKNLNLDWRRGAAYFEAQLVDYDVTSNWGNWAYNAGVGNDPRDRYFNIVSQAERYDPKGRYVKHWCPELKALPDNRVHEPHQVSAADQASYGVQIGTDYPAPMIDLEASYREIRAAS
ncbi:MAG: DASH family cryptochrome [Bacteroidota bacterium]